MCLEALKVAQRAVVAVQSLQCEKMLIFCLLLYNLCQSINGEHFECSEEFAADFQLYGSCVTQKCGRFLVKTPEKHLQLIDEIANILYAQEVDGKNATIAIADLASDQITLDASTVAMQAKHGRLLEQLMEEVCTKIRSTVQDLFHITSSKLWIAKPMLMSWMKSNESESKVVYTKYHTDQLTHADTTCFHYTVVIYLDNDFEGGHLQFRDGPIFAPSRGLTVIFTSGMENRHRVTPIFSGLRRSLTIFLTCDEAHAITATSFY